MILSFSIADALLDLSAIEARIRNKLHAEF